ncbi:Probable plastidic glucose transporter 2 [Linum perenne]
MASRQLEAYSMYKRMPSRDHENMTDVEDNEALLQGKFEVETTNPSWRRTLPHVLVATIPSLLFGYHLGVVNEPLESISLDLGFDGHALAEGLVVSISLVGSLIGSLFSGSIVDSIGRCKAFQLSALPMILGPAISASTKTLAGMLIGRFLVGIGMGLGPVVASLYVTEISPAHVRGTYGSFIQIATCLGFLVSLFFGLPVREIKGWLLFTHCSGGALVFGFLQFLLGYLLSLFHYVLRALTGCSRNFSLLTQQGKIDEAEAEFERLLGGMHVESAMNELHKVDRGDDVDTVKFSELLLARNFRVVFIGSTLFAFQQLSGINTVFNFSSTVFKSAGVPSEMANIVVGVANLFGSIIAMALMDKQGRKSLLIWSFFGLAVSMGLQGAAASSYMASGFSSYLSVGAMLMCVLTFSLGAGPVPGLLLPEIIPNRIRAKAMAICMSVGWVINFFVGFLFLWLLQRLGRQLLYTCFAAFCLMAVAFVRRNVMETKGKSLHEIEIALLPPEF